MIEVKEEQKVATIPDVLGQIVDLMCRDYCKYGQYETDEELEKLMKEHCEECPMVRLMR
ncbi:MAG: hypothetical protein KBT03_04585 [Bacteroidales bacterium]|nr:hypothetical protein [Candidatus Scybalousia scybalohippi]